MSPSLQTQTDGDSVVERRSFPSTSFPPAELLAAALAPPAVKVTLAQQLPTPTGKLLPRIIHLVRHGHGQHNAVGELDYEAYKLECNEDAVLTELGIEQCNALSATLEGRLKLSRVEALLVSPMRRTLETAQHSFPQLSGKVPWVALETLREQTGLHPCDRRRTKSELSALHPHVDFSRVFAETDPLYPLYPDEREPSPEVNRRCQAFLDWLFASDLTEVVVVTHSAFIRHLLCVLLGAGDPAAAEHFDNCEMRSLVLCAEPGAAAGGGDKEVTYQHQVAPAVLGQA